MADPTFTRRTVVKSAAWSLPVIAAAVYAPQATASVVIPPEKVIIDCVYLGNHGHGGDTGNGWWRFLYSDGSYEDLSNGVVMSDPELKKWTKGKKKD